MTEIVHGIEYSHPTVVLLQETGIGTSEYAARTCYDSFETSENECVKVLGSSFNPEGNCRQVYEQSELDELNSIEHSDLLDKLAWTHFHYSILEHANLTYLIKGTSRGVLQEHARHRIQGISVRSTRYTMSSIINAFVASLFQPSIKEANLWFHAAVNEMDLFVVTRPNTDVEFIFNRLYDQRTALGPIVFDGLAIAKSSLPLLISGLSSDDLFIALEAGPKKRNVGDAFKHIVTDNWKVDMVVTFNLRSLKNYFQLRDSGAAYFQIQWLAKTMKKVTPTKYLDLIIKA